MSDLKVVEVRKQCRPCNPLSWLGGTFVAQMWLSDGNCYDIGTYKRKDGTWVIIDSPTGNMGFIIFDMNGNFVRPGLMEEAVKMNEISKYYPFREPGTLLIFAYAIIAASGILADRDNVLDVGIELP